tara:strand:- start:47 stop:262 length:216 start_codon:yes stop_codon:yes gene_type:complete
MDMIILTDGMYHLIPVTKELLENVRLYNVGEMDFFDLCEILRIKLTTYASDPINAHMMNDGSGDFFGCIWK